MNLRNAEGPDVECWYVEYRDAEGWEAEGLDSKDRDFEDRYSECQDTKGQDFEGLSMIKIKSFLFRTIVRHNADPSQLCKQFRINALDSTYPHRIFMRDSSSSLTVLHFWLPH